MSRRAYQAFLLVLLAALVTDEVHAIYSFKRAPNQFRKRVVQMPLMVFAWVSQIHSKNKINDNALLFHQK